MYYFLNNNKNKKPKSGDVSFYYLDEQKQWMVVGLLNWMEGSQHGRK